MHHFRKKFKSYNKFLAASRKKQGVCSLCEAIGKPEEVVSQGSTMVVLRNLFPYDIFEERRTTGEHYMILPRRHVTSFSDFDDQERNEYFDLMKKHELQGFNIYSRGVGSSSRSQVHQHTQLIKLVDKPPKFLLLIMKPYLLIHK